MQIASRTLRQNGQPCSISTAHGCTQNQAPWLPIARCSWKTDSASTVQRRMHIHIRVKCKRSANDVFKLYLELIQLEQLVWAGEAANCC